MSIFLTSVAAGLWRDHRWSLGQFEELQRLRMERLVRFAGERVPFYARRYRGVDPLDFEFTDLPVVTKGELLGEYPDTVSGRGVTLEQAIEITKNGGKYGYWIHNQYLVSVTGGTSGKLGYFLNDRRSWRRASGLMMSRTFRNRLGASSNLAPFLKGERYRMAFIGTGNGTSICTQICQESPWFGGLFLNRRFYSILEPYEQTLAGLNEFQPRYLHSYSSFVEKLARAQLAGELRINPRFISLGSESAPPLLRAVIARAFPEARVVNQYGCTECPLLANECPEGRMHLNPDCSIVELCDVEGRPVKAGEASDHILVTNLLNRAQPIIRYRVDDSLTMTGEACPCGRPTPVVLVNGRSADMIWLKKGQNQLQGHGRGPDEYVVHPALMFEILMYKSNGMAQFQLVHEKQNELRLTFVPEPGCRAESVASEVRGVMDRFFQQQGLTDCVQVRIDPTHAIERTGTQKIRSVMSKVPAPRGIRG